MCPVICGYEDGNVIIPVTCPGLMLMLMVLGMLMAMLMVLVMECHSPIDLW